MEWLSKKLQSDLGAEVIFFGGDSLLASAMANERLVTVLENIRQEFHSYSGYTLSVGIASSLQISYLALKLAKASGKNRLQYSR
jgi:nucleotidyltransferase/DNA polymerase involved in DNA repair